jgi:hypothetical protein
LKPLSKRVLSDGGQKLNASILHTMFLDEYDKFEPKSWRVIIFEGSPENGLYSWCPDCIVARQYISDFEKRNRKNHHNAIKIQKFHVGSRSEWESRRQINPFKKESPYLVDLPSVILYYGNIEVIRLIAPCPEDFQWITKRIKFYDKQIRDDVWHPPKIV